MQNVTILGITLQDRTLQESLATAKRYLGNGALDIVAYVDHDILTYAEADESVRNFIEDADMTLWEDEEILEVAGIFDSSRYHEVESRAFLRELLQKITDDDRSIIIACEDENSLGLLKEDLLKLQPGLNIVHEVIMEVVQSVIPENAVNTINEHLPAMVICRLDYAQQATWLGLAGSMINTGIWLAIPPSMDICECRQTNIFRKLWYRLSFGVFSRRAKKSMEG